MRVLDRRVRAERDELVHLAQLRRQRRRRDHVADLPPRHVIRLAERADDEAAGGQLGMARHALVAGAVENDVLVDFVADDVDAGAADDRRQRRNVAGGEDGAGRDCAAN